MNNYIYDYRYNTNSPIPAPKLNGGLYTGESFQKNAPWANVIVHPTGTYMNYINLRSAEGPEGSWYQIPPGGDRFGNNSDPTIPEIVDYRGDSEFGPFKDFKCLNKTLKRNPYPNQVDPDIKIIYIG